MKHRFFTLTLALSLAFCLTSCGESQKDSAQTQDPTESAQTQQSEVVFYDGEYLKAIYIGVTEQDAIPDTAYVQVQFENKSDEEITITPTKSAVNDTQVQYLGGLPATIQPGKKLSYSWFFTFQNAGISSIEDIETLETALQILNSDWSTLEETDVLELTA